jgi:hypothetical protein
MLSAFLVALFIIGAIVLIAMPVGLSLQSYFRNRGRRNVICPENHEPVTVEPDSKYAFFTALRGQEHERLQSCTRWPEKGDCGQECLAQVDPTPENLERLLQKWYQGKTCTICDRALTPADWRRSRLALLNEKQKLFELRHMHLDEIPSALDRMAPLCWNCHQEERARQAEPPRLLKGDRTKLRSAMGE